MNSIDLIIPYYNRKAALNKALQSLLRQSFKQFTLIVADDGSRPDQCLDLSSEWGDRAQWLHLPHGGVSWARNQGFLKSSAPWVAFLDSDDEWHPDKLKAQWDYHQAHPDCNISQTEEIWIRKGKRVNAHQKHGKGSGDIFSKSLELCTISPSSVMMRREVFEAYGPFEEKLLACEDYHLWLKIAAQERIGLVPEPLLIKYGGHEDQLSRRYPAMDRLRIWALFDVLRGDWLNPAQRREALQTLAQKSRVLNLGAIKRGRDLSRLIQWVATARQGSYPNPMELDELLLDGWEE